MEFAIPKFGSIQMTMAKTPKKALGSQILISLTQACHSGYVGIGTRYGHGKGRGQSREYGTST